MDLQPYSDALPMLRALGAASVAIGALAGLQATAWLTARPFPGARLYGVVMGALAVLALAFGLGLVLL